MATYTNQTKNSSVLTNQPKGGAASRTWDNTTETWDEATGTWDDPSFYNNQDKSASTFTNQPKN